MSRYYFHRRGELARDRRGRQFESHDAACDHAVRRTPSILGKLIQSTTNTYLTTEVTDGERELSPNFGDGGTGQAAAVMG